MAGIYIHIPFCKKACIYCNFHFSTSLSGIQAMVEAIGKEAVLRKDYLQEKIDTIYFGGGTPSLLDNKSLNHLLQTIHSCYRVSPEAEVSLEANPDDIYPVRLQEWKTAGINRLSVGVQSFNDRELKWMNRGHDGKRSLQCLTEIREAGFENFSADLIFGSVMSDADTLEDNLKHLIDLKVPHISAYGLTVEPRTRLYKMMASGQAVATGEEIQSDNFLMVSQMLQVAGYEHYEISNYAIPGFRSRHNSSYWNGTVYVGLGPSAHSFDGLKIRSWNISDNKQYLEAISKNELPSQSEILSEQEMFNEQMMIGLRKMEGISLNRIEKRFGAEVREALEKKAFRYISANLAVQTGDMLILTPEGKLQADGIASALFSIKVRQEQLQFGRRPA